MSAFFRCLLPLIAALSMLGCVVTGGESTVRYTTASFSKIVPGKTTKNEVVAMLGRPERAHQYRAEQYETWEYSYRSAYQEDRTFWVQFHPNGTVAGTDDTKDFYAYPYRGR